MELKGQYFYNMFNSAICFHTYKLINLKLILLYNNNINKKVVIKLTVSVSLSVTYIINI